MALSTLTLKPYGERILETKYITRRVEFENGEEQVQLVAPLPIKIWELKFSGTKEMMDELQAFFDARKGGSEKFYWTDSEGETHTVRFVNDSLKVTQKMGFREDGTFGIVGFETTVQLRKVWQ